MLHNYLILCYWTICKEQNISTEQKVEIKIHELDLISICEIRVPIVNVDQMSNIVIPKIALDNLSDGSVLKWRVCREILPPSMFCILKNEEALYMLL